MASSNRKRQMLRTAGADRVRASVPVGVPALSVESVLSSREARRAAAREAARAARRDAEPAAESDKDEAVPTA